MSKSGIKLLIVAQESSGKTTLVSKIKDALIMSTDNKAFKGKVAHFRYSEYNGLEDLINTLESKLETYAEKYGDYPKTLVVDSVTHLANNMERWANSKFTGFNIWSNLGKDILDFNAYLEELVANGLNVVITAHTTYDPDTTRYKINSPGSFGKQGSWVSVTDEARFIEIKSNKRILHYRTMKFPCRTLQEEYPDSIELDKYDINEDITILENGVVEAEEWSI